MPKPLVQSRVDQEYVDLVKSAGLSMGQFVREAFIEKVERDLKPKGNGSVKKATAPLVVKRVRGRKAVEETIHVPASAFANGHCPHRFASVCDDCAKSGGKKR